MTTENNTWCGQGAYYDGEKTDHFASLGVTSVLMLKPQKIYSTAGILPCRSTPYSKLLYERVSKDLPEKCPTPCRPPNFYLCNFKSIEPLPICKNVTEESCFNEVKEEASRSILVLPCMKLQYKFEASLYPSKKQDRTRIELKWVQPGWVWVKVEYLLYDFLQMISAIGGTLGLCIGFSFKELSGVIFRYLALGINRLLNKDHNQSVTLKKRCGRRTKQKCSFSKQKCSAKLLSHEVRLMALEKSLEHQK